MKKTIYLLCLTGLSLTGCLQESMPETFALAENGNGPVLGYSPLSGVKLLNIDRYKFKDLNKNGKLDKYEDWRLPADERAEDLASRMSIEQIAGLMLYSRHQALPSKPVGFGFAEGSYNGKTFEESSAPPGC